MDHRHLDEGSAAADAQAYEPPALEDLDSSERPTVTAAGAVVRITTVPTGKPPH